MSRRLYSLVVSLCVVGGLGGCVFVKSTPKPTKQTTHVKKDGPRYVVKRPSQSPPPKRTTNSPTESTSAVVTEPPKSPRARRVHRFKYYPNEKVYYSPGNKRYYWMGPRGWVVGIDPPASISASAGATVSVELATDTPFEHHDKVAAKHPGHGKGHKKGKGKGHEKGEGKGHEKGQGKGHEKHDD
jgi:hypothetical protein